jgi:hypothetical protein
VALSPFDASLLATLAFLVVFRVLIRLFFSIDITHSLLLLDFFPRTDGDSAGDVPNLGGRVEN